MENKVTYSPFILRLVRSIQLAKEGLPKLLLSFIFLLVLNSCSKEATLDEVRPASAEATSVLKEWATKNDKLNQAHLKGIDEEIDHIKIAQKFVEPIAILLNELYNMDIRDARILATTGLSSIPENIFSKVLASLDNKNPITEIERKSVINNFSIQSNSREYGTSCN
jgi:hypothetical protein